MNLTSRGRIWLWATLWVVVGGSGLLAVAAPDCPQNAGAAPPAASASTVVEIQSFDGLAVSPEFRWVGSALPTLIQAGLAGLEGVSVKIEQPTSGETERGATATAGADRADGTAQPTSRWTISGSVVELRNSLRLDLRLERRGADYKLLSRSLDKRHLLGDVADFMVEVRRRIGAADFGTRSFAVICFKGGRGEGSGKTNEARARSIGADLALSLATHFAYEAPWASLPWKDSAPLCEIDHKLVLDRLREADAVVGGSLEVAGTHVVINPVVWLRTPDVKLEAPPIRGSLTDYSGLVNELAERITEYLGALGSDDAPNVDLLAQRLARASDYLALVDKAASRRNRELNAILLREALAIDPQRLAALVELGQIRLAQGRYEEAKKYLTRAARQKPGDAIVHETLGDLYFATDAFPQAAANYIQALDHLGTGNAAEIHRKLGDSYFLQRHYESAVEEFQTSSRELARAGGEADLCDKAKLLTRIGQADSSAEKPASAIDSYQLALAAVPGYPDAEFGLRSIYLHAANQAIRNGAWQDAELNLQRAMSHRPNAEVYEQASYLLNRLHRYEDEIDLRMRAADNGVNSPVLDSNTSHALLRLGHFEQALNYNDRALASLPGLPVLHANKAEILYRQGRGDEALVVLQDAAAKLGQSSPLVSERAKIQALLRPREAERTIDSIDPTTLGGVDLAEYYSIRGMVTEVTQGCAEALPWYAKVRDADPDEVSSYLAEAYCLGQVGDFTAAVKAADAALAKEPNSPHALSHKAYALYQLGEKSAALALSEQVVKAEPSYGLGHLTRARLLATEGATDAAIAELALAVKCEPLRIRPMAVAAHEFAAIKDRADFQHALDTGAPESPSSKPY